MLGKNQNHPQKEGAPQRPEGTVSKDPKLWDKFTPTGWAIAIIGTLLSGFLWIFWGAINNVDDDVRNLTKRVNEIDKNFGDKMEKLTGDIGYIKGRIENLLPASKPAKIVRGR